MRIGRFDESMIPVAVVKGEERTITEARKITVARRLAAN